MAVVPVGAPGGGRRTRENLLKLPTPENVNGTGPITHLFGPVPLSVPSVALSFQQSVAVVVLERGRDPVMPVRPRGRAADGRRGHAVDRPGGVADRRAQITGRGQLFVAIYLDLSRYLFCPDISSIAGDRLVSWVKVFFYVILPLLLAAAIFILSQR